MVKEINLPFQLIQNWLIARLFVEKKLYIIEDKIIIFPRFAGPKLLSNKWYKFLKILMLLKRL